MKHDISDNIIKYLEEESPYKTIVLKGDWGIGKTFLWEEIIEPKIKGNNNIYYCSLFGIKNKEDLLTELIFGKSNIQDAETTLKDIVPGVITATKDVQPIGVVGTALIGIGKIMQKHVENTKLKDSIIVLDDLERKDLNFSTNELMGFINFLKSKNNKILLMLNEDELNNIDEKKDTKSDWQLFKEKVIDIELTLNLTTEDLINILKEKIDNPELVSYNYIFNEFRNINVKNIRIAQLILNRVSIYAKKMEGIISQELIQNLIKNCVLCYYMYYTNFKNLSPKELLKHIDNYKNYIKIYYESEKNNTVLDKDYEDIYNFLSKNNFYPDADFNEIVVNDLKNGYILNELDAYISKVKDIDSQEQNDMKLINFNERLYFDISLTEDYISNEVNIIINKEYKNYNFLFNTWEALLNIKNDNHNKIYDKLYKDTLANKININYYNSLPKLSENIKDFISKMEKIIQDRETKSSFFDEKKLLIIIDNINNHIEIIHNKKLLNKYSENEIRLSLLKSNVEDMKKILRFYYDMKNNTEYEKFLETFKKMINEVKKSSNPDNDFKGLKRILNLIPEY